MKYVVQDVVQLTMLKFVMRGDEARVNDDPIPANNGTWYAIRDNAAALSDWTRNPALAAPEPATPDNDPFDHNSLRNRNLPKQHVIDAIDGLRAQLDALEARIDRNAADLVGFEQQLARKESAVSGEIIITGRFRVADAKTGYALPGSVVGRLPVYDASGAFIGYAALYDTIG